MEMENLNERLYCAVMHDRYDRILYYLKKGAKAAYLSNINCQTAVCYAAGMKTQRVLELLLKSCVDPAAAIFQPSEHDLEVEKEIELYDDNGYIDGRYPLPALGFANLNDYQTQYPHVADTRLMTPLHYAAACGNLNGVSLLLEHNAPIKCYNIFGLTPLYMGAKYANIVRLLLNHDSLAANYKEQPTTASPLHAAIRARAVKSVWVLLQHNADVNAVDELKQTPLMCAAFNNLDNVAIDLLERGAMVNAVDFRGHSALYFAIQKCNRALAVYLLEHGAQPQVTNSLLHECVRNNDIEMAKLLLNYGADYSAPDNDGLTPIHLAIMRRRTDMLEFLLETHSAQPATGYNISDFGVTLLTAVHYNDAIGTFKLVARLLFQHGVLCNTALYDYDSCDTSEWPCCERPLSHAIWQHKLDFAVFLIKEGMDVSEVCFEHVTKQMPAMLLPHEIGFAKFLRYAGFKISPAKSRARNNNANKSPEQLKFEKEVISFYNQPLSLLAQARIAVRKSIIVAYTQAQWNDGAMVSKYRATKDESSMCQMINSLHIPKTLKTYLHDFDDCTPNIPPLNNTRMLRHLNEAEDEGWF